MAQLSVLREEILSGKYDAAFSRLYPDPAPAVRERYLSVLAGFEERFGAERDVYLFSAPGRTELGGNHTDHNGGKVLAGAVNRDVICAAAKAEGESVMTSLAFGESRADASDLLRRPEIDLEALSELAPEILQYPADVRLQAELGVKYEGYLQKQRAQAQQKQDPQKQCQCHTNAGGKSPGQPQLPLEDPHQRLGHQCQ